MCGICGMFDLHGDQVSRDLVVRMSDAIRHRGPDGDGLYVKGPIGLGHRRLSIIDLEGGAQPIANEDGRLQVVFNGEIYNFIELREELENAGHVFATNTDTEVIVHGYEEWGLDFVTRFNGMFAFALWDGKKRELILARDHLGIKPLYYTHIGNQILFASEIKALLADPRCTRQMDHASLGALFTLRYVPSPATLFENIKKVPPGHIMVAGANGIQSKRFWSRKPEIEKHVDEQEAIEKYQALVEDTVRLQMRADVPVGLFLSSGVDSASLLALMGQHSNRPVHTFTIGFEQGERTNETAAARDIASRFGAVHSDLVVTAQDYQSYYERYLWDIEEPVGNETAAAFHFVSMLARRDVKVALTGQGADEPWAGYHRHLGAKLSGMYRSLPRFLTDGVIKGTVERFSKNERLRRGVVALSEPDDLTRLIKTYSFYTSEMKAQLFQPWLAHEISVNGVEARKALGGLYSDVADLDPLTQILYMDTRSNLPDDLLMVGDKTAMANSLEARVPFLDYRLIEFIETLPPSLKIRGLTGKYLHKKALEKWLPKSVVHAKKKGFSNPIDQWLRAGLSRFVGDCLLSEQSAVRRYFEAGYIKNLLTEHEAGRQRNLRHIYLLISLELWHQQFAIR